jgi:AcrR family transcriptional regulator
MMGMAIPYLATGRTRQKSRTHDAMIAATRQLLAEGVTPTVEQAADRAGISRTTAYRYFANQRELLIASYPKLDEPSLLDVDASDDPIERLDTVTAQLGAQLLDHETELRASLRLSLETPKPEQGSLPLRQGRVITWLEDALSPLKRRMRKPALRRLVLSVRAVIGIEPLVWLTDVARVDREEAIEMMRDSARTLVRAAIADL